MSISGKDEEDTYGTSYYYGGFIMNDREITIEEENDVLKTADRLCELIKSSAEFNEYRDALEALKADDNLYKQVEEIRKNNFLHIMAVTVRCLMTSIAMFTMLQE